MGYISFDPGVSSNTDQALATVPESGGASKNRQEHEIVAIATTGQIKEGQLQAPTSTCMK